MAMKVFNVGDVLGAADLTEYLENTRFAIKAADTSRNTTITPTSDPDLTLTADASKTYLVTAILNFRSASATPGFRLQWTAPAGAVLYGAGFGSSAVTEPFLVYSALDAMTVSAGYAIAANTTSPVIVQATLVMSATGGTFALQWAQSVSNATNTTLMQGSSLLLRRVS